jgi:hypothetical protein
LPTRPDLQLWQLKQLLLACQWCSSWLI